MKPNDNPLSFSALTQQPEEPKVEEVVEVSDVLQYENDEISPSMKEELAAREKAANEQKAVIEAKIEANDDAKVEGASVESENAAANEEGLKPIVRNARVIEPYEKPYNSENIFVKAINAMFGEEQMPVNILPNLRMVKLFDDIEKEMAVLETEGRKDELEDLVDLSSKLLSIFDITGTSEGICAKEDADLRQGVLNKVGKVLRTRRVEDQISKGDVRGDIASLKILKFLGLGEPVQVLLPHSGFWVTLTPPNENEIISYFNVISRTTKRIGRESKGLTFGNMSVEINDELFRFIKRQVTNMTLDGVGKEDLDKYMIFDDFQFLIAGFLGSFSPDGVPFKRICNGETAPGVACTDIIDTMLDTDKLAWIDNSALTEYQKEIISFVRPKSITLKDYEQYKSQFPETTDDKITIRGITFEFKRPTFRDHTDDGLDWIASVTTQFNNTLSSRVMDEEEKEERLSQFIRASTLRNYSHYIKSIAFDGKVITDKQAIRVNLAHMSSIDDIANKLEEAIVKFRNNSIIGVIGVPEYQCPVCGKMELNETDDLTVKNIIPLDILSIYFLMFNTKFHATVV